MSEKTYGIIFELDHIKKTHFSTADSAEAVIRRIADSSDDETVRKIYSVDNAGEFEFYCIVFKEGKLKLEKLEKLEKVEKLEKILKADVPSVVFDAIRQQLSYKLVTSMVDNVMRIVEQNLNGYI